MGGPRLRAAPGPPNANARIAKSRSILIDYQTRKAKSERAKRKPTESLAVFDQYPCGSAVDDPRTPPPDVRSWGPVQSSGFNRIEAAQDPS